MILIFSLKNDTATIKVSQWLRYYNEDFKLIENYSEISNQLQLTNQKDKLSQSNIIWYRKYQLQHQSALLDKSIKEFLDEEYRVFLQYVDFKLNNSVSLGKGIIDMDLNKLIVLEYAEKVGFNIPKSLVTTSKEELLKFKKKFGKIITKPFYNPISYFNEGDQKLMLTTLVNSSDFDILSENFFPSLFQEYIEKEVELRVFYLDGDIYSSAMFTQMNFESVDNRENDMIRIVPFKLPFEIEERIRQLMKVLDLNTGSLDLILNEKTEYYFLEINPSGIFEGISSVCNFNIHQKIANWLILKNKGNA